MAWTGRLVSLAKIRHVAWQRRDIRDAAVILGAAVIVPFVDNGAIEFAHLTDPLGNRFGIWRPKAAQ